MDIQNIGILHPGEMGISVAATIQNSGHAVYWVSQGRSPQTRARAEKHGLLDAGSLAHLCEICSMIVSVCPPDAAEALANHVVSHHFTGLYLDANAISPQRAQRIGQAVHDIGGTFVDGGIIGGPAWTAGSTWLYLSGEAADRAATCFAAGPLETRSVGNAIGKASALKMCFAAYTKGTTALLAAVLATAEALNVRSELEQQWGADFAEEAARKVKQVTAKAWRFTGEMDEIASTFAEAGMPDSFHIAAGDVYSRMAEFKGMPTPSLETVLQALLEPESTPTSAGLKGR
jgi:3-hydroxyisobutyrate dehydrogenase-like beta-hydroxyacid dehydrogenase